MKLDTRQVAKPWGRAVLPAPFHNPSAEPVGEIWFEAADGPALPLMIKYLFTAEKLSIQVHPSDAQARAQGQPGGKEECWLVIHAEPGATLGIGTKHVLDENALRAASLTGEIEQLMDWKPVVAGDFFYIPAGTVHAIGAGISLIEIQQNADITYRLYDYGRPRALHLDDGIAVSRAAPYDDLRSGRLNMDVDQLLVDGPLFRLLLAGAPAASGAGDLAGTGPIMIVPLQGSVHAGADVASAGECLALAAGTGWTASDDARLLIARAV